MSKKNKINPRVLLLISTIKHDRGGHFYSLKTIYSALKPSMYIKVMNIGLKFPSALEGLEAENTYFNGLNYLKVISQIIKYVRKQEFSCIHAYDQNSFLFARIIGFITGIPFILTKCGGPNPPNIFPFAQHLVLFSKENIDFFKAQRKFRKTIFYHLPNRATKVNSDEVRINRLRALLSPDTKVFLRIARIGSQHLISILQSIELVTQLKNKGAKVTLLIIGYVERPEILEQIKKYDIEHVSTIISDDEYTINSNQLIEVADIIIGTGRGIMEAASFSKPVLVPLKNYPLPVPIDPGVCNDLFYYNFSPRTIIENFNEELVYSKIERLIYDDLYYKELSAYSQYCFKEHFIIDNILDKYKDIYSSIQNKRFYKIIDLITHLYKVTMEFIKSRKPY